MNRYLIGPDDRRSKKRKPLQCAAKAESTGKRCSRRSRKGSKYCGLHSKKDDPTRKVLSYYADTSSEELRAKLMEIADLPIDEKKTLDAEVELLIHLTSTAWTVYDQVCVKGELDLEEGKSNGKARGQARVALTDAVDRLSRVKIANAKLDALRGDKVSADAMRDMACQIMDVLEEELEDKDVFRRICRKIEGIKMEEPTTRVVMDID